MTGSETVDISHPKPRSRRAGRLLRRALLVAVLVALLFALAIPTQIWRVTRNEGVFGEHLAWNGDRSVMFVSALRGIIAATPNGDTVERVAVVPHRFERGVIGTGGGWAYYVARDDPHFLALNVGSLPTVDPHGPAAMLPALGFTLDSLAVQVVGDVAFVGGFIRPAEFQTRPGVIVAFDVSDPESITTDPSSLRPLYRLDFETAVVDIAVQGSFMYVLQGPSRLNILDLTVSPPELRASHMVGGGVARLDVQGDLLAVTDAALVNNTVRFYRLSGTEISLDNAFRGMRQTLEISAAYDRCGSDPASNPGLIYLVGYGSDDCSDAFSMALARLDADRELIPGGAGQTGIANQLKYIADSFLYSPGAFVVFVWGAETQVLPLWGMQGTPQGSVTLPVLLEDGSYVLRELHYTGYAPEDDALRFANKIWTRWRDHEFPAGSGWMSTVPVVPGVQWTSNLALQVLPFFLRSYLDLVSVRELLQQIVDYYPPG